MNFTEVVIKEYAKKIFRFAYSKTNNYSDAEDLSQDIILELCDISGVEDVIENMDAYIYRICCYTWSKYLRKNKRKWDELGSANVFEYVESKENIEGGYVQKELGEKLRQEIMYLTKLKREITILFYYENKKGDEIAKVLGIPASTVRWHLSQAKNDLRGRIEMEVCNEIYKPIKLKVGRNGWGENDDILGLQSDVLLQNICWICHGKALTIEEMSRTLGVAAVYLEDKIEKLLYMDYIKPVGKNKYQTNFFIPDGKYQLTERRFHLENVLPMAKQFYKIVEQALPQLKEIDFNSCEFNDEYLMWQFIPLVVFRSIQKIDCKIIQDKNLYHACPKRRDGTKHWACASIPMTDILNSTPEINKELREFCEEVKENSIKMETCDNICGLQFDLGFMTGYRNLDRVELAKLKRVKEILDKGETPNNYDKEIIADLIREGYVSNEEGKLKILVPYLTSNEMQKVDKILQRYLDEMLDEKEIEKIFNEYVEKMNKEIPSFVDKNERNHLLTGFSPYITILWLLYKNGYLKEPTIEEKKHLCTIMWEV